MCPDERPHVLRPSKSFMDWDQAISTIQSSKSTQYAILDLAILYYWTCPKTRTKLRDMNFKIRAYKYWKNLPTDLKSIDELDLFRARIKTTMT